MCFLPATAEGEKGAAGAGAGAGAEGAESGQANP